MDTTNMLRGWLFTCRKRWNSVRLSRHTSPFFIKTVLTLFLIGSVLQWFR